MKNIHILPTDKPSRLYLTKEGFYFLLPDIKGNDVKFQNICITNSEEIKEGDWVKNITIVLEKPFKLNADGILYTQLAPCEFRKIILITDQDLIKDGVQTIDDEFLEWFVKNPSCEEVEVEKYCRNGLCDSKSRPKRYKMDEHHYEDPKDKCWYSGCQCPGERLIVPKEIHLEDIFNDEKKEGIKKLIQKQKLIDMMEQDEQLGAKWQQENTCNHNYILTSQQGQRIIKCQKCNNVQPI